MFFGSEKQYAKTRGIDIAKILVDDVNGYIENIKPFFNLSNFEFIEGDIRDLETCRSAVNNIDFISHQAALGSVPRSIKNPLATSEANTTGFLNMLLAARDAGVKRLYMQVQVLFMAIARRHQRKKRT